MKNRISGVLKGVVDEQTGKMVEAAAGCIGTLTGKMLRWQKMMTIKQP